MKTFKFNDNVIEYEDDVDFNGNEFIRDILADKTTQFCESEFTKRCEIQTNGAIKTSEEATKRTENYATMCNSKLGMELGGLLAAIALSITAFKVMPIHPTNPTPEAPKEEKKEE